MKMHGHARVIWPAGFDERARFELPFKGWLSATIELEEGYRYPVHFSDPTRLQQELDDGLRFGRPYFAEPGLIILPEVTVEAIEDAVQSLQEQGFFTHLLAQSVVDSEAVMAPEPA